MAIEPSTLPGRRGVAWVNSDPDPDGIRIFKDRGFLVSRCDGDQLRDERFLAGISAAIFVQKREKLSRVVNDIADHAERLLDFDCRVCVSCLEDLPLLRNEVEKLGLPASGFVGRGDAVAPEPALPYIRVLSHRIDWHNIANFIADHPAGHAPAPTAGISVVVDERDESGQLHRAQINPNDILIRRAFWDCKEVHLVPMQSQDGRSGVPVYRAHAELESGQTKGQFGQWPQPYFIKIGLRDKILEEYENYRDNVDPYIPFHLGPHLVYERCCLGAKRGIIVGDYVDESESLRTSASKGRGTSAIACLFDRTLIGWYRRAVDKPLPISAALAPFFPTAIPEDRRVKSEDLGATKTLLQLRATFDRCLTKPVLIGPAHGDLHSSNVRVRATDAIVIDFCSHCDLPLVYDAACLEASFLVEGFNDDERDSLQWFDSIKELYGAKDIYALPLNNPKNRSFWFHASVRQIRQYARAWERGHGASQYAIALATALLFKASKDPEAEEKESYRRAACFVFAEHILANFDKSL